MRPPKTYPLTLEQIECIADALSGADGHISYTSEDKPPIQEAHMILMRALGPDVFLVYAMDDGVAA